MLDEEEYKRELIRMWDSLRTNHQGEHTCAGVRCEDCPLYGTKCGKPINAFGMIEAAENWAKENPQKHKVSQLEYDIILVAIDHSLTETTFNDFDILGDLLEKGYFKGATLATNVGDYINNCEVDCKLGGNENVKRRKA